MHRSVTCGYFGRKDTKLAKRNLEARLELTLVSLSLLGELGEVDRVLSRFRHFDGCEKVLKMKKNREAIESQRKVKECAFVQCIRKGRRGDRLAHESEGEKAAHNGATSSAA